MGMRAVELQIAVPRTSDAGKIQQEHLIRPALDQAMLADQLNEQADRMRTKSDGVKESSSASIHDGHPGEQHASGRQHEQEEAIQEPTPAEHPYKGKHIDLSF
ncbi:hypothetical protein [Paenibacillus wulumuqiensis]|uniref:hypothetical protein n=1 Tax=Paenibacillus wulumuqiensis TaxID=1567107 RepID=UPI000619D9D4|nr:hypothetical protein [Paenibacillus wulumuqiensis]